MVIIADGGAIAMRFKYLALYDTAKATPQPSRTTILLLLPLNWFPVGFLRQGHLQNLS